MSEQKRTRITFLGTSSVVPEVGEDTASFVINDQYLVDTGWFSVDRMRAGGIDPAKLEALLFTHLHHDHYVSLPSLLFYLLNRRESLSDFRIIGPANDVHRIVNKAMDLLETDVHYAHKGRPQIIPLIPGESYEDANFRVDTCSSLHPVQGLCYRFTDKNTNAFFSFTGDTAYHPPIADHVKGSPLLIHEASIGPVAADPEKNAYLHAGALDAARIAALAGVSKLVLVHGPRERAQACVEAAKQEFAGEVIWPDPGQTIEL